MNRNTHSAVTSLVTDAHGWRRSTLADGGELSIAADDRTAAAGCRPARDLRERGREGIGHPSSLGRA